MFGFFIQLAIVVALAKSMSSSFQFYKAAAAYAFSIFLLTALFYGFDHLDKVLALSAIKGVVALPYFYLLDYFEDTLFTWLLIFGIGFTVLLVV